MTIADEIQALSDDRTAIQNAILAKGGTVTAADGFDDFATAIASIPSGGGGLPVIKGSFTAGSAGAVQTINIPYTGNGYPLLISCVVKGGTSYAEPYKITLKQRNAGIATLIKANPDVTPTYSSSDANTGLVTVYARTSSTSAAGTATYSVAYTSSNPSGSSSLANIIKVSAKNSFKIYIADGSVYGFYPGQEYDYWAIYSE